MKAAWMTPARSIMVQCLVVTLLFINCRSEFSSITHKDNLYNFRDSSMCAMDKTSRRAVIHYSKDY